LLIRSSVSGSLTVLEAQSQTGDRFGNYSSP
jgi:hypothetical protein